MTGTRAAWHSRTIAATSSVDVRIDDDVGRRRVGEALAVAVLLAHRRVGHRALAVVGDEPPDERRDGIRCGLRAGIRRGGSSALRHSLRRLFHNPVDRKHLDGRALALERDRAERLDGNALAEPGARRAVDQDRRAARPWCAPRAARRGSPCRRCRCRSRARWCRRSRRPSRRTRCRCRSRIGGLPAASRSTVEQLDQLDHLQRRAHRALRSGRAAAAARRRSPSARRRSSGVTMPPWPLIASNISV